VLGARERRQFRLKGAHFRPHDELAVIEDAPYRCVDGRAKPAALGGDVNKGNGRRLGSYVH
jgi:hypothetical protein